MRSVRLGGLALIPFLVAAAAPDAIDEQVPSPPAITQVTASPLPGEPAQFTFTSVEPDVVSFTYGWTDTATQVVPATGPGPKTAIVTVVPPRYGINRLYVHATDADGDDGAQGTLDFLVGRPSPEVAWWPLEANPAVSTAQALLDARPAPDDTPLSGTGLTWKPDVRLIGAKSATFNGTSTVLTASGSALDTTGPYGVAAWIRLAAGAPNCVGDRVAVSADGAHVSAFSLGFDCATGRWRFRVADQDTPTATYEDAWAPTAAVVGDWTHVAGTYDPVSQRIRLYVDGVLAADRTPAPSWVTSRGAGWDAGQVVLGRSLSGGHFLGQIVDVRLFDRAIVDHDLTGQRASDPGSGGVDEPGIVTPVELAKWGFTGDLSCYDPAVVPCEAVDQTGRWNRRLALTMGSEVGAGRVGEGLVLDGTHWFPDPSDPHFGLATQEYGWSQTNAGSVGTPDWQDKPVLRTDGSFTVSTWVRLDDTTAAQTFVAQDSTPGSYSGFTLGYRPDNGGEWVFSVRRTKTDDTRNSVAAAPAATPTTWHHLVAVLDVPQREVRLYVDGLLSQAAPTHPQYDPWQAAGPLLVGRGSTPTGPSGWLTGGIDEVTIFQGAHTDAAVAALHAYTHG